MTTITLVVHVPWGNNGVLMPLLRTEPIINVYSVYLSQQQ